jgi:glycosyltransferase involved in cell wall biosynthesis
LNNNYVIKFEKLIKNSNIIVHPFEKDINVVYEKSDLILIPSIYETGSFACIEAFSYGLPVICKNVYGLKYLIENEIIDIKMRAGGSIIKKLKIKIGYYSVASLLGKKDKFNRLSFYDFDKHAIMNLCKLVNNRKYNISGVYQKNDTSFWFPDFIVYKMDIQEYILFDPQDNLVYDKLIE